MYLLDANVLMTANNTYYPIHVVPEFWAWLAHQCATGHVKMPIEIFEEVKDGSTDTDRDQLYAWVHDIAHRRAIVLDEDVDLRLVQRVISEGYANDLTDNEVEQLGRDPFLIAYALASPHDRCVVTTEASKPRKQRQNRRIPDVCNSLGVRWIDTFSLVRELRFSTGWQRQR
jgi:hypothetical protein